MDDLVFNIAKGRVAHYATLPATNDAIVGVLLKAAGLQAEDALKDHDTLAAVLAASNDECDFTGYARITLSGTSVAVDDTANVADVDSTDPGNITNGGVSSQAAGCLVLCYDPDTTTGTDADLVPLVALNYAVTFDPGVPVATAFHAEGWFRAQDPA